MKFTENAKDAANLLKATVPELSQHKLPVNPYNYSLWYAHFSGLYSSLSKELSSALKEQGALTQNQSLELFKKHIINDLLAVDGKLEQGYQTVMNDVSESANKTEQNAGDLEQELVHSLRDLKEADAGNELMTIVNTIAEKTRKVSQTTKEFQGVLNKAQDEISRLKEELKEAKAAADKDGLTHLFNRRYFDNSLTELLEHPETNKSHALILVDVDHFKNFNDNYGHLMGDLVLKALGKILIKAAETKACIPCRFGGEEFAILMPNTPLREAKILAENTRKKIFSLVLKDKKSSKTISNITASFGVTALKPEDTEASFVERADKALYKAKQDGRDQVASL
jgi:diguanylate cyclase